MKTLMQVEREIGRIPPKPQQAAWIKKLQVGVLAASIDERIEWIDYHSTLTVSEKLRSFLADWRDLLKIKKGESPASRLYELKRRHPLWYAWNGDGLPPEFLLYPLTPSRL